ncbi:imelysin LruB [Leptospira yasudae]|uniref:Peptidase M75 n=1 Tax=Leptospira yasudae TaxID=2202201 RepID=A0A6N4QLT3_9LEPT|nr:imelysin family protein [Leptospira yasudae]TGL76963.1 peptidase M75 [Leptospira yasudae]TGL83480.1 peptidase M75 [Leptospira yasudae]TGL84639.1 peptidase M75 [Leptospira yasudae]
MNLKKLVSLLCISAAILFSNCKPEDKSNDTTMLAGVIALGAVPTASKAQVVDRYLKLGYESYDQSYKDAVALQTAVNTFAATATPTAADHTNLKNLYVIARASYLVTEAFRFSSGPVDNSNVLGCGDAADGSGTQECEGLLNAWPLDEVTIDNFIANNAVGATTYTNILAANGNAAATNAPTANEGNDEKVVLVGWHAIEYLLWGQDLSNGGINQISGQRPVSDFANANASGAKRKTYLKAITDAMVAQLKLIRDQYATGTSYSTAFKSNPDAAITAIFQGLGKFIAGEWGGQRLTGTFDGQQEEEHSCFSDTTKADFYYDAQGVLNVWNGSYELKKGNIVSRGPGLGSLFGTLTAPPIVAQTTASRDAFCLNLPEQTSDPNYTTSCPSGSLTGRYDQIIRNVDSEYNILFNTQKLIGDTLKKTITSAANAVGVSITDFSI